MSPLLPVPIRHLFSLLHFIDMIQSELESRAPPAMEEEGRARAMASSSRALARLLVLFLCLSHLLSCLAVPATRNLNPLAEAASSDQDLQQAQEEGDMSEVTEGRMDMEQSTDYPGTGANNHHDPKPPGRV